MDSVSHHAGFVLTGTPFDTLLVSLFHGKGESMNETIEMYICETAHVILHINQPYIFRVHPFCDECARLAYYTPKVAIQVNTEA